MKKQTVYMPTRVERASGNFIGDNSVLLVKEQYDLDKDWVNLVKPTEGYFFTPEELKKVLSDYTDKIVENAQTQCDEGGETGFVNKESIQNQLTKILKELEL